MGPRCHKCDGNLENLVASALSSLLAVLSYVGVEVGSGEERDVDSREPAALGGSVTQQPGPSDMVVRDSATSEASTSVVQG